MSSKSDGKLRAILVEAVLDRREGDHLSELSELARVSGYEVVDRIVQNIERPTPDYYFGKGKTNEIKGRIKELEADVVIIENRLDNNQITNLQKKWHAQLIDRFELILEIFIKKAGTQEAITQIRLAALKKMEGTKNYDFRSVHSRHTLIKKLEKKLELIKKAKDLRRKRRMESGFDLIAIAGYTNAGKSTLMNALTSADVEVDGRMFTTLNTTTRSFDTFGRKILITDTVGLISRLPHVLMDAFYATLKEIKDADVVLLLIDSYDSIENIKRKVLASINTLTAIEAYSIPIIPVLNKIDIAENVEEKEKIVQAALNRKPIKISAMNNINLEELKSEILRILETFRFHLKIPNNNEGMSLLSKIHNKTRITNEIYHTNYIELEFETNARLGIYLYNLIKKSPLEIEILNKEELEKHIEDEKEEDKISVIKLEDGEEIVIFDLVEESNSKNKVLIETPDNLESLTEFNNDK
ncbi:MAG TPA: GTPase [candidate division Zixibacteria bacterium]|nr:GTPase [candidate division Zixibacteria bacterium]